MPLDVIIATPSGAFGELIRLTLEADPDLHCTLIERGEDIKSANLSTEFQALIFDCAFSSPQVDEIVALINERIHPPALLLIPVGDTNGENSKNEQVDGYISRPFDPAVLPIIVMNAIKNKQEAIKNIPVRNVHNQPEMSQNFLSREVNNTSALGGIVIQEWKITLSTLPEASGLQESIFAAVMENWNPGDSSDLIRYIKNPDVNQNVMVFATPINSEGILAIFFDTQTPVTRVHAESIQVARALKGHLPEQHQDISSEAGLPDMQEAPLLNEILASNPVQRPDSSPERFPVEWFTEDSLPGSKCNEENARDTSKNTLIKPSLSGQEPAEISSSSAKSTPTIRDFSDFMNDLPEFETPEPIKPQSQHKAEIAQIQSETEPSNQKDNLGDFQAVGLMADTEAEKDLDQFQPVSIEPESKSDQPDITTTRSQVSVEFGKEIWPLEDSLEEHFASLPPNNLLNTDFIGKFAMETDQENETAVNSDFDRFLDTLSRNNDNQYENSTTEIETNKLTDNQKPDEFDKHPVGDPEMENPNQEQNQNERQPEDHSLPDESKPIEFADVNLFARMNDMESAAKAEEPEIVTAALIPLDENFILHKHVATQLNQCMVQLCQAFGWKLENLTIRPTYMQWQVAISNLFSPQDMVEIVRKQTTQCVTKNIPGLKFPEEQNDLWAAESMLFSGLDFTVSRHWQNFILRRKNEDIV